MIVGLDGEFLAGDRMIEDIAIWPQFPIAKEVAITMDVSPNFSRRLQIIEEYPAVRKEVDPG